MSSAIVSARRGSVARRVAAVTLVGAAAAFLLGPHAPLGERLWPETLQLATPPAGIQVLLFTAIGAIEALAFGAGLAVLVFGWKPVQRLFGPDRAALAAAAHLSVFWLLWSWWLHVALHNTSALQPGRILVIEYAFHASSIAAAGVLAYALYTLGIRRGGARAS